MEPTAPPRVRTQISVPGEPTTARSTESLVYVTIRRPEGQSSQTLYFSPAVATTTMVEALVRLSSETRTETAAAAGRAPERGAPGQRVMPAGSASASDRARARKFMGPSYHSRDGPPPIQLSRPGARHWT